MFDALTRRRSPRRRPPRAQPNAAHDVVLASLGFRPRRRVSKPARVMLILLGGAAVIAGWTALEVISREARASEPLVAHVAPPTLQVDHPPASLPDPAPPAAAPVEPAPGDTAAPLSSQLPEPPLAPGASLVADAPPTPAPPGPPLPVEPIEPPRETAPPASMAEALYHHRAGDFDKALAAYRSVLRQNELNAAAHNNLGLLYQERGQLDEAVRAFQRAIILDERYALAHSNYGVTLLRQGRPAEAAAQFRRALEIEPRNADVLVNLALAARASGARDEAGQALQRALAEAPHHPLAHYNFAVLQDEAGDAARAIVHYRAYLDHAGAADPDRAAQVRARLTALTGSDAVD